MKRKREMAVGFEEVVLARSAAMGSKQATRILFLYKVTDAPFLQVGKIHFLSPHFNARVSVQYIYAPPLRPANPEYFCSAFLLSYRPPRKGYFHRPIARIKSLVINIFSLLKRHSELYKRLPLKSAF
jgi:hypothetical protein